RVEAMQSQLLERQRLRREVRYYASLQDERERLAEELRRHEEAARAAEEARRAADEARRKAEEEARRQSETNPETQTAPAQDIDAEIERETLPPPTNSGAVTAPNMTIEGLLKAIDP